MQRQTKIKQYSSETIDLDKIKAVAGNEINPDDIIDYGKFVIARSGKNHNRTDITSEGQHSAVNQWVGCPIYYDDHKMTTDNQIGRIYDAWCEDVDGETVTYGRAFGCNAKDAKEQDKQSKIKNKVNREMSCAYDVVKSSCSICGSDTTKSDCASHGKLPEYYARDIEFKPNHVSFVGNPAVDGAGLVTHARSDDADVRLNQLADDGKVFRDWTSKEFAKWYRLNNKSASAEEIKTLSDKLSAKEMVTFARIEQSKFQEIIPSGQQQLTAPAETTEAEPSAPKYRSIKDIFKQEDK